MGLIVMELEAFWHKKTTATAHRDTYLFIDYSPVKDDRKNLLRG